MGFQQGLSGLNVSSKSLQVIGNNVANANTFGAKTARAEFADMYAASLGGGGSNNIGIGATIASVAQQFTQGNITTTDNPLDIAINGDGFFKVQRWDQGSNGALFESGEKLFTRNGQFKVDNQGYIENNQGHKLLNEGDQPIKLALTGGSAQATSNITMDINLNASETVDDAYDLTAYPPLSGTYTFSTTQTVYDGSGQGVGVDYYYRKSGNDTWDVYTAVNGTYLPKGATTPAFQLTFDATSSQPTQVTDYNGTTYSTTGTMGVVPLPPITGTDVGISTLGTINSTVDWSSATQYAGKSVVNELAQNGYPRGDFSSFSIDSQGGIQVRYTNGQTVTEAQIGLARFNNSQGLEPKGGNEWGQTAASGPAQYGNPGAGRLGLLQGGALEESNVDLTGELVNMIVAQRTYQANAQTIKTEDQVLQTLVNIR
ncbi:flagellar hook protein FlgE [Aquabacterium sp.]|uniref:flagellar hook protein FlgE n=1 Tax=Aquabacterium sp. TaxID=1872578 RepID=UPI0025C22D03|nr:flagellar hook protein FlgE [Aquabacterium sp.]